MKLVSYNLEIRTNARPIYDGWLDYGRLIGHSRGSPDATVTLEFHLSGQEEIERFVQYVQSIIDDDSPVRPQNPFRPQQQLESPPKQLPKRSDE